MLLTRSEAFRASWIFFTCPSDRMRIARSSKDVLVAFFLIPYLLVVSIIYSYVVGNVAHVLVHVAFLVCWRISCCRSDCCWIRRCPFQGRCKGARTPRPGFFGFTAVTVLVSLFIQFYSARIYSNPTSAIVAVA